MNPVPQTALLPAPLQDDGPAASPHYDGNRRKDV